MRQLTRIIRNTALLAVAAIVVLAGVLLFNAFTHGSRQIQVSAVARVPIDQQAAAARLSEAIPFKTISNFLNPEQDAEALRGLQAHIAKSFPAFHAAAKREVVGGYSLLYTWEGSDAKALPIALLAHQDVVPIAPGTEKDWQQWRHQRGFYLGPRIVGRQGQPLFDAGGRRTNGRERISSKTNHLFRVRP